MRRVPGLILFLLLLFAIPLHSGPVDPVGAELDRQRLIGAAHYENDDFGLAAQAFQRCVELAPDSAADRFNLALSLMRGSEYDEALRVLDSVATLDPGLVGAEYVRGIVFKNQNRFDLAVPSLEQVVREEPTSFGAHYNLGVCRKQQGDLPGAKEAFEAAIRLQPEHPSARYQMIILAREMGEVDEAKRHAEVFDLVKNTIDESEKTVEALERSRFSVLIDVPRAGADLVPDLESDVRFVDVSRDSGLLGLDRRLAPEGFPRKLDAAGYDPKQAHRAWVPTVGGAIALGDADGDTDLDIFVANCASTASGSANRLHINRGDGRFVEMSEAFGVDDEHRGMDAIFGDYDNDGQDDLYVVNDGPNVLYRKTGDGAYEGTGSPEGDAGLVLLDAGEDLPDAFSIDFRIELLDTGERLPGGYVVVGYRAPGEYVFAGADVDGGFWAVGHYDGAWVHDAQLEVAIPTGRAVEPHLQVRDGMLTLYPDGIAGEWKLSHDFGRPLSSGAIGLAVGRGAVRFDDLRVVAGEPGDERELYEEGFNLGRAERFTTVAGRWRVVDWTFEDVSRAARVDEPQLGRKAIFVDYDHDNDLDIYVVNGPELSEPPEAETLELPRGFPGQVNTLLRNNGNGTFADLTDEAGLLVDLSQSRDVLSRDLDGDHDTDLLVANADATSLLFSNRRLGRFAVGGSLDPPLDGDARAAVGGDFDRDGRMDLTVAVGREVRLYANRGKLEFAGRALELPEKLRESGIGAIEILDHNNDGWSDLLLVADDGSSIHLLAGDGKARFRDVTSRVGLDEVVGPVADVAVGDLDGDGDEDLVLLTRGAGPRLLENRGGNRNGWLQVIPAGKKVNRNGYGATVEIAAGGHYQKKPVDGGPVHFGLGSIGKVDVVRITWPNGVAQNVISTPGNGVLTVDEQVKVSASCGFLWAHDGGGFRLINEILGIGPLGAPIAPDVYHRPDSTELTKIEADQLVPRNGVYELRLTEELRETMYGDRFALRVVDHPAELEIVPNEMFTAPPFPEDTFFAVGDAFPPRSAVDHRGRNVTGLVSERDGRFPTFDRMPQYDGLAELHSLTLDPGELPGVDGIMLYLDGWIYWPEASTVMALAQDPRHTIRPLSLQVVDEHGRWRTAIESVGLPTSKGLVVPVDLTGLFPTEHRRVRLTTNLSIYFDRIFFSTRDEAARCRVTELPVARAGLSYRGFSAMRRDSLGFERFDYDDVDPIGSWSPPEGMLTRYGEVTELLSREDNRFVIFGPGDELTMEFDAESLPVLPAGWTRDFVFYANGWVKDGDLNTKYSESVEPLPFHGMSAYPYPDSEGYPDRPELREYREQYNTRPAVPTVGELP